jgi:hypothetical protein
MLLEYFDNIGVGGREVKSYSTWSRMRRNVGKAVNCFGDRPIGCRDCNINIYFVVISVFC